MGCAQNVLLVHHLSQDFALDMCEVVAGCVGSPVQDSSFALACHRVWTKLEKDLQVMAQPTVFYRRSSHQTYQPDPPRQTQGFNKLNMEQTTWFTSLFFGPLSQTVVKTKPGYVLT